MSLPSPDSTQLKEFDPHTIKIYPVTSFHLINPQDIDRIMYQVEVGDLNNFMWPENVVNNLKNIHPDLIACDSIYPRQLLPGTKHYWDQFTWTALPGLPSRINPEQNKITIVAGDINLRGFNDYLQTGSVGSSSDLYQYESNEQVNEVARSLGINVITLALSLVAWRIVGGSKNLQESISRRKFIKLAASGAAALGMTRSLGNPVAIFTQDFFQNHQLRQLAQQFVDVTWPPFGEDDMLSWRTALVNLKLRDALEKTHQKIGVSLMGSYHTRNINNFAENEKACQEKIQYFTPILEKVVYESLKKFGIIIQPAHFHKLFSEYVAQTEIIEASDPLFLDGLTDEVKSLKIGDLLVRKDLYNSPKVLAAINRAN